MKLTHTLLLSGLMVSCLATPAQAATAEKVCEAYAKTAWNEDGKSPYKLLPECVNASVVSDPHITTFKGLQYDFNFSGDYTLMELQDSSGFSMLSRFVFDKANKVSSYTIPEAVKFQWPGHSAEIHRGDEVAAIFIDGKLVTLKSNKAVKIADVGYIARKGSSYFVMNSVSDIATVVNANKYYLDLNITAPRETDTLGLLGRPFDLSLRDRSGVELPITPDTSNPELNKADHADFSRYAQSWLYTEGNPFTTDVLPEIPDFGAKIYTLADLSSKKLDKAQTQCETLEAEFPERFNRYACLLDIGLGGNKFARSAHHHQPSSIRLEILD